MEMHPKSMGAWVHESGCIAGLTSTSHGWLQLISAISKVCTHLVGGNTRSLATPASIWALSKGSDDLAWRSDSCSEKGGGIGFVPKSPERGKWQEGREWALCTLKYSDHFGSHAVKTSVKETRVPKALQKGPCCAPPRTAAATLWRAAPQTAPAPK